MRKPPAIETNQVEISNVNVLSLSPMEEDHLSLQHIFNHSKWTLCKSLTVASALDFLKAQSIAVVLCESDLLPGTWKDLLEQITGLPCAPAVIVSSRLADDQLWAEALNLGAWEVLGKPFDKREVFRAVSAAWRHWKTQQESPVTALKVMTAAG